MWSTSSSTVSCQVRPRELLSLACDFTAIEENLFGGHHSISHFHFRHTIAQWTLLNTGCSLGWNHNGFQPIETEQKKKKSKLKVCLLYPEVFIQPTLTEYLLCAKISAECGNQKIIRHPPWHLGMCQLITEGKFLYCNVISDTTEKSINFHGNMKEKHSRRRNFHEFPT